MYNEAVETWEQDGVECNLYVDYNGDMFDPRDNDNLGIFVCRSHNRYSLPQEIKGFRFEDFDSFEDAVDCLKEDHGAIHIYPVWMYEHSGVIYSMGERKWPFDCPWDSSMCGIIFTTEKQMDYLGVTDRSEDKIQKWLASEVEEYSDWACGDVYYYNINCPDGESESLCGLIGYEYACEEAEMALKFEAKCYRERSKKEKNEREYWANRDVVTI